MFNGTELLQFVELADYVALNDYEAQLMQDRTGKTLEELSKRVKALIVTLGANGSAIYVDGKPIDIAPVKAKQVVDPTGCGDAFRGALLHGLAQGWTLARCVALGNRVGALKIAQRGGQNHQIPTELLLTA